MAPARADEVVHRRTLDVEAAMLTKRRLDSVGRRVERMGQNQRAHAHESV